MADWHDMTEDRQLLLPLLREPAFDAADFIAAPSNEAARIWLGRMQDWPDRRLMVWGQPGCGKTHLLHIWASRVGADLHAGASLGGLPNAPASAPIAIDDADLVPDERALLHLLNGARDAAVPVLLTGRVPPSRFTVRLPDLASRLRAITSVEIAPPEDVLLRLLLAHLLADRQTRVSSKVQDWLLQKLPRTPAVLREAVARLDHAALLKGVKIHYQLANDVLRDLFAGPDDGVPDDGVPDVADSDAMDSDAGTDTATTSSSPHPSPGETPLL